MAIQYPSAGAIFYTQVSSGVAATLVTLIANALASCGWTSTTLSTNSVINFTGTPSNGDTVSIGGKTYTFVTVINNAVANQVLINGTSGSGSNLAEAINGGAGSGTDYSSATTANANVTASGSSAVRIISNTAATNTAISTASSAMSVQAGGYKMDMPTTPQGLKASVWIEDVNQIVNGFPIVRFRIGSPDGTVISAANSLAYSNTGGLGASWLLADAGRTYEFCGNAHQFFMWIQYDASASLARTEMGVPYIRPYHTPQAITNITNDGTGLIKITIVGHGLSTGDDIFIADAGGVTAANGFWTITKVDANNFTLNTSTFSGAYTTGGLVANRHQIARCMWIGTARGAQGDWRDGIGQGLQDAWVCTNQFYRPVNDQSGPSFDSPQALSAHPQQVTLNWGEIGDLFEPRLAWSVTAPAGIMQRVGQLWAAFLVHEVVPFDRIKTGFDGHNWIQLCDSGGSAPGNASLNHISLWIAKT